MFPRHKSRFLLISLSPHFMCSMLHVGRQTSCADSPKRKGRFPPHLAARLSERCREKGKINIFWSNTGFAVSCWMIMKHIIKSWQNIYCSNEKYLVTNAVEDMKTIRNSCQRGWCCFFPVGLLLEREIVLSQLIQQQQILSACEGHFEVCGSEPSLPPALCAFTLFLSRTAFKFCEDKRHYRLLFHRCFNAHKHAHTRTSYHVLALSLLNGDLYCTAVKNTKSAPSNYTTMIDCEP